jgi:glutaredoxin
MDIILLTGPGCPHCHSMGMLLNLWKQKFQEVGSESEEGKYFIKHYNVNSLPQLEVDGELITDLSVKHLKEVLKYEK